MSNGFSIFQVASRGRGNRPGYLAIAWPNGWRSFASGAIPFSRPRQAALLVQFLMTFSAQDSHPVGFISLVVPFKFFSCAAMLTLLPFKLDLALGTLANKFLFLIPRHLGPFIPDNFAPAAATVTGN